MPLNTGDDPMSGTAVPSLKRGRSPGEASQSGGQRMLGGEDRGNGSNSLGAAGSAPDSSSVPGPQSAPGPSTPKKPRLSRPKQRQRKQPRLKPQQTGPLHLHIRMLWNLLSQNTLPVPVSPVDISNFNQRFTSANNRANDIEKLIQGVTSSSNAIAASVQAVKHNAFLGRGIIAKQVGRIEDSFLEKIFSAITALGLDRWAPDVTGGHPDSVYNLVHEQVAISTFKMLLASFVYRFMNADMTVGNDNALCVRIYRQFVFGHIGRKVKEELRKPGSVEQRNERTNTYKRRSRLRDNRIQLLKNESFRPQVLKLALESESHSDDELDDTSTANMPTYLIRKKVGRAHKVAVLFHILDSRYEGTINRQKGQRGDRIRKVPVPEINSQFTQMPKDVPIDFFDPDYFNNFFSVKERAHYAENGVALPSEEHCESTSIDIWKNLSEAEFMETYGNAVLAQYKVPTKEEIEQLDEYEDEDGEESSET
ncbi:hypothetical protein GGU11DRAFT_133361 [Lentinula aff. detonsa]|nr:hypothetical protein GGU11DRAFT_133361 [Lentinula aff. detonsa]